MKTPITYKVIGLMSGTSLDGLDLAYCEFRKDKAWSFKLKASETRKYNSQWRDKLKTAHLLSGEKLVELDNAFGAYLGKACQAFMKNKKISRVDFIASHGHTIFHQPKNKFTYQLGNGHTIHAQAKIPVIYDFRSLDVARGGEGAPLVPIGDQYLFHEYDVCLNLGGIANLSRLKNKKRIAFDICYANMGLNYLAGKMGKEFDHEGKIAAEGSVDLKFVKTLEAYYSKLRKTRPSLGREGFEEFIQPLLDNSSLSTPTKMRSFCESICVEIDRSIPSSAKKLKLLATGGGASNLFLMQMLKDRMVDKVNVIIPDRNVLEFKEAIVFGLLGVLRKRAAVNILKSVTGASMDSCSGAMIGF